MAFAGSCAGCLGADEEVQPVAGDFAAICRDVFTADARVRAGGRDCARLTRSAASGVEQPSIELRAIELDGRTARVNVRTRAPAARPR